MQTTQPLKPRLAGAVRVFCQGVFGSPAPALGSLARGTGLCLWARDDRGLGVMIDRNENEGRYFFCLRTGMEGLEVS
jgi:hypothetical protein